MIFFELVPTDGRKSFYGKAMVALEDDGTQHLYSYHTEIMQRNPNGELFRIWDGWSVTTQRHIKAFCGLNKKEYFALPHLYDSRS